MRLPDLRERHVEPELMDQPDLDEAAHHAALRGLARINAVSRSAAMIWPSIARAAVSGTRAGGPVRMLDVACGGGDVAVALWQRARRAGIALEILAVDASRTALERTRAAASAAHAAIRVRQLDALTDTLPGDGDLAVTSLFLHHLANDDAVRLLRAMARAAPRIVVNDLERTRTGYVAARIGTRMLSTSPIVHVDGPRSVQAALSLDELRHLAREAGLDGARVERRWPFRMLLEWERR